MDEQAILKAIVETYRKNLSNRYGAVYPWMVLCWLEVEVSEKTVQRRMKAMAQAGKLIQVGLRSGYRLPVHTQRV